MALADDIPPGRPSRLVSTLQFSESSETPCLLPGCLGLRRAEMVEHPVAHMEWQRCPSTGSRYGTGNRCLPVGAGGSLQWDVYRKPVVPSGENTTHNQLELLAGSFAVQTFAKDRRDIHIHLRMDNNTARCYVSWMGGDSFSKSDEASLPVVAMVPPERHHLVSRVPTGLFGLCCLGRLLALCLVVWLVRLVAALVPAAVLGRAAF